jgi:hypothetical protein
MLLQPSLVIYAAKSEWANAGQRNYEPPLVLQGTPGPKRLSSTANSAQAVTRAMKEMINMTVYTFALGLAG